MTAAKIKGHDNGKSDRFDDDDPKKGDEALGFSSKVTRAKEEEEFDFASTRGNKSKAKIKEKAKNGKGEEEKEAPATPAPKHASGIVDKPPVAVPVVARLERLRAHPGAKKLFVCTLDIGVSQPSLQVVCGGTNLREGMCTVLAPVGSTIKTPEGPMAIKPVNLRGFESQGMLCGEGELGLLAPGTRFSAEVVELAAGLKLGIPFEIPMFHDAKVKTAADWLAALLAECSINNKLACAERWCAEKGVRTSAQLVDAVMAKEFAQSLVLKPAKENFLLKRLASRQLSGSDVPKSQHAKIMSSTLSAALGVDNDEEEGAEAQVLASSAAEIFEWLLKLEIPRTAAAAYASQLCARFHADLEELQAAEPDITTLDGLNLKRGHAMLLLHELRLAKVPQVPELFVEVARWFEGLEFREVHTARYVAALAAEGLQNCKAIKRALEVGVLSASKLATLGMLRGHVLSLLHEFRNLALPSAVDVGSETLAFRFGTTRTRLRGPAALTFPPDEMLPIFPFNKMTKSAMRVPAPAWEETAEEETEFSFGTTMAKLKKKTKQTSEMSAVEEGVAEFDFGAKPKKKKKLEERAAAEEEASFSFAPVVERVAVYPKQQMHWLKSGGEGDDGGTDFEIGLHKGGWPTSKEKQKDKKDKTKLPITEELEAQRAKEAAEITALLAELDEPKVVGDRIKFSLGMIRQQEADEGEDRAAAMAHAQGASVAPVTNVRIDTQENSGDCGYATEDSVLILDAVPEMVALEDDTIKALGIKTGKKGKKEKKKRQQRGGAGAAADEDDEMALLDAAMAENQVAKAESDGMAEEFKDTKVLDEGTLEGAESCEDGKLTKAQKKKLKAKAKKAAIGLVDEGDEGGRKKDDRKKPSSKLACMLREEQERRTLEEAALTLAAELTEEAQHLFKSLNVLALGEKALRRLDSAEVSGEVDQLGARAQRAVAEYPQFEKVLSVAAAVRELQAAMKRYLDTEEKRRLRREKEKERKERLRDEGKLISATERAKRVKQEAYLQSLKESSGVLPSGTGNEGGEEKKKRVVYSDRKKKQKPSAVAQEDAPDDGAPSEGAAGEGVPSTVVEAEPSEAAPEGSASEEVGLEEATCEESEDEGWDALDIGKIEVSGLGLTDEDSEEEEFVAPPSSKLSSQLEALAAGTRRDEEEAKRKKEETLSKLYNYKRDEEEDEEDFSDDSGSDSDSDNEVEMAKVAARAERERRAKKALATRSPDRLRSPICCIMGHVDTGKTKLLDNIRRTNVQDNEAGGITQQIGASFFPSETLVERMGPLVERKNISVKVPGLMIIDTPGHESFSNLRSRGSSLCDIAILVIDIMHGLEPQTIESLHMLRGKKTPFVIALNKVDRLYGWKHIKDRPVVDALMEQEESVRREFEDRASRVILALAEQGLNAALYYRNTDFREYVSLVPTSAHTGEGVPDILMLLVQLSQKLMIERIMWSEEIVCTVLEIKVVEGLGATADVMLANGTLKRGDRIVMCGFSGPVVTRVRELLTPKPLREMRVKTDYLHHDHIDGSAGIKICANHLEGVVAGSACLVPYVDVPYDLEVLKEDAMIDLNKLAKAASEVNGGVGVYAMSSTLGSLEALLEFLKSSKIPVSAVNIGPIHKRDVIKASIMHEHRSEYATILAFDVPFSKETEQQAKELNVKVFTADIIYHLFDKFTAYMAEVLRAQQDAARFDAVFPVICEISSPEHVWCRGGGGDPLLIGINVLQGTLRKGTPLCVERRGHKDFETGLQSYLDIGRVLSMEKDRKPVDKVAAGNVASVKIDAITSVMYGRQFDHTYTFYPRITRSSINAIKDFFKDDMSKDDWTLLLQLKKRFGVI